MKGFDNNQTTKTWDELYYSDPLSLQFYDMSISRVLSLLNTKPGDKVLDAGCGAGVHAIRVAKLGCHVDAIDFSTAALDDARSRAIDAGLADDIAFSQEDLTQLSFASDSYDNIFSWGVLIHIPEIEKALDELARILAVGGRLALYVSNHTALQLIPKRMRRRFGIQKSEMQRLPFGYAIRVELHGEPIWVWFNDVPAIVRHLEKRGLKLVTRQPGEFSDFHLRFSGIRKRLLLRLNNFWFRNKLPASWAQMNLIVFEKKTNSLS